MMSQQLLTLRETLDKYDLHPKKKLGQHFLLDQNLTDKIARKAGNLSKGTVIEIGPGPGGLTRSLLNAGALAVIAIEYDSKCCTALEELVAFYQPRLKIIEGDALEIDIAELGTPPRKVVANLPYNIATELLFRLLPKILSFDSLTLMFQKEVAERLLAKPRTHAYGRVSIMIQWLTEVQNCFDIPAQAFFPPPKVVSTLVQIIPREKPLAPANWQALSAVTKAAFSQRRKMLRSSLKSLFKDKTESILQSIGINPTARAEELSVEEFCRIANLRPFQKDNWQY